MLPLDINLIDPASRLVKSIDPTDAAVAHKLSSSPNDSESFTSDVPTPSSQEHHKDSASSHHRKKHGHPPSQPNFYNNSIIEKYAAQATKRVTLRQLTVFGRHLTEDKLLRSANYIREELPVRLAHRIRDFQHLPFIVGTNPHIEHVYSLYYNAFEKFRSVAPIQTLGQNHDFCELVESMLNTHLIAIPQLAMGIAETARHMDPETVNRFMNEVLRSRIGRRVLAEQHIHLSAVFEGRMAPEDGWIGIVNTRCQAANTVRQCASVATELFRDHYTSVTGVEPPLVVVNGHENARFTYIPDHIEYILVELLKNSMRFTFETHAPSELKALVDEQDEASNSSADTTKALPKGASDIQLPPIKVTIGASDTEITFRISDEGGGIPRDFLSNLWSYSHASKRLFKNFEKMPKLAAKVTERIPERLHLGLGLPMSRVYANYWGGGIAIHSMHGYGTDAYVKIAIGNQFENLTYEGSAE
ncbi:hypothetical protein HDV05_004852 [Chytridiales sp. JEL 0842]|nr:hypothetical protein HDV05_004852 [Chytridiales sp. JEL 0842]